MNYITITTRHHEGFCLFNSRYTEYDVMDKTALKRDLIKEMADACQAERLKLCLYYSLVDWHHPDYYPRGKTGKSTARPDTGKFDRYVTYMQNQLTELLTNYGPVTAIWFDGEWDGPKVDWRFNDIYNTIHRMQPNCLVGNNHHHATVSGEDFQMFEQGLPGANTHGWIVGKPTVAATIPPETCETMNKSWGYNVKDNDFKSAIQIEELLVKAAALNANLLLNVGPTGAGLLTPQNVDTLAKVGRWVAANKGLLFGRKGKTLFEGGALLDGGAYVSKGAGEAVVLPAGMVAGVKTISYRKDGQAPKAVTFERTRVGIVLVSEGRGVYNFR